LFQQKQQNTPGKKYAVKAMGVQYLKHYLILLILMSHTSPSHAGSVNAIRALAKRLKIGNKISDAASIPRVCNIETCRKLNQQIRATVDPITFLKNYYKGLPKKFILSETSLMINQTQGYALFRAIDPALKKTDLRSRKTAQWFKVNIKTGETFPITKPKASDLILEQGIYCLAKDLDIPIKELEFRFRTIVSELVAEEAGIKTTNVRGTTLSDLQDMSLFSEKNTVKPMTEVQLRTALSDKRNMGCTLEENGIVKGFCISRVTKNARIIINILIHPDFRNKGFGTILLKHMKAKTLFDPLRRKLVITLPKESKAIGFFTKNGFEITKAGPDSVELVWRLPKDPKILRKLINEILGKEKISLLGSETLRSISEQLGRQAF